MQLTLERHAYAPELNKVVSFNGCRVNWDCPGAATIAAARKKLGFYRRAPRRIATIEVMDSAGEKQNYTGVAGSYADIARFVACQRQWHTMGNVTVKSIRFLAG